MHRRCNRRRCRAGSSRRSARLAVAAFLVFAGAGLLLPGGAWGQCVQDGTTVTCSGDVTDGFDGSDVDDLLVEVEEQARVSIDGDGVAAMAIGYDSHVNNRGTITAGGNDSRGVETEAGSSVINYGTIEASGDGGTGVEVKAEAGRDNNAVALYTVDNRIGAIITGGSGSGAAVRLGDPGVDHESNQILELRNYGSVLATGDGSAVIGSGGADRANNEGVGTITGAISLGAGDDIVRNQGTITGPVSLGAGDDKLNNRPDGLGSAATITGAVSLGDGADTIQNGGILAGAVSLGAGDDGLDNWGTIAGAVSLGAGDDTLTLRGIGIVEDGIDGGAGADTLELTGSASFDLSTLGNVETVAIGRDGEPGAWFLSGSYTGDLEVRNGRISMDDHADLTGSFTQTDGTELWVQMDSTGPVGVLHVTGDVSIGQETLLYLELQDDQVVLESGTYSILTWTGDRDGEFEFEEAQLGARIDFLTDYDDEAGALQLVLTRNTYESSVSGSNTKIVAAYVDAGGGFLDPWLNPLNSAELQTAMEQLSVELYDTHTSAALSWGRAFTSVLKRRPLRCESLVYEGLPDIRSESPCGERGWMPWAEPIGQYAKRDGGWDYVSYDRLGAGLAVGADKRLSERWTVSASLAASRIGTDLDELGNTTLTTFDFGLAASLLFGPAHVRAVASYGHGWHTTRRDLDFLSSRATGDHDSNRFGMLVEAGYEFELGPVRIEPLVEVDYAYIGETAVVEEGAGPAALRVDVRSNSQVGTAAGLRISGSYYKYGYLGSYLEWLDGVITPEVSALWRRVWTGADRDVAAYMVGAPAEAGEFEVFADDASAGLEIGARIRFQPQWSRNTVELGYEVFVGNDTTVHNLGAQVRIPF